MKDIFVGFLLGVFIFSACAFPGVDPNISENTSTPGSPHSTQTLDASEDNDFRVCAYIWANQPLPELSTAFNQKLNETLTDAEGFSQAYGENCVTPDGDVVRFLAMQTDYYITLRVDDLQDEQMLGERIEQVMGVIAEFPPDESPGPHPGYIGITFVGSENELRLWVPRPEIEAAMEEGLRGRALFTVLQRK